MSRKDRKFKRFFRQKLGDLQKKKKKKKKVFAKIQSDFSAEIVFFFLFKRFFRPKSSDLQKNKKGLRQNSRRFFFQNFASSNVSRGALFAWGGYFQFFTENRPQKHKKHAILHTSQANGGARAPPAPPWLRYCVHTRRKFLVFVV